MASAAMPTRDDFAALLNESLGGENEGFEGRVVKGTVTAIENDHAVIDVGLKSEGRVPLREFAAPGQKADLKPGDEVEVYVDRVENVNGEAVLSRDRARRRTRAVPASADLDCRGDGRGAPADFVFGEHLGTARLLLRRL